MVRLAERAPWGAATPGRISPAADLDYFTFPLPQAGVLVVETSGATDTKERGSRDPVPLCLSSGDKRAPRLPV